jgi:hypothetical protein
MFCCRGNSSSYDPIETTIRGTYPGSRREVKLPTTPGKDLVQTGGNALMEYDPETMSDLIRVVVPPDSYPGQMIQVTAPDDSNRIANAIIPPNCKPGSTFMMKFPPIGETMTMMTTTTSNKIDDLALQEERGDFNSNSGYNDTNNGRNDRNTQVLSEDPLHQSLLENDGLTNNNNNNFKDNKVEQKMIITVPPGVDAGTTLFAKVPGEGVAAATTDEKRFLPVQVPKGGVSQFYVSYVYGHTINERQMIEQDKKEKEARLRKNQNWHDNPLAYAAPMVALPVLL